TATSLALIAIGAIFTFAVTAHPSFLNLQIAGVVIMATGIAGLFLRKPTQGWLRRRTTLRRGARGPVVGHVDEKRYPPYVMLNPAADPEQVNGNGHQPGDLTADEAVEPEPSDATAPIPDLPAEDLAEDADDLAAPQAAEVVEEYIQE
ncbi:MAG TPA: hypothetical protein VMC83_24200, partial [Streptosporangiaceae bacterium]|nr:hypothetical protein [Streptosporangiaceae bacterium]